MSKKRGARRGARRRNPEWVPTTVGTDAELRLRLRLREFIARIGARQVSRRLGVTEKTLKEWVRIGVSKRFSTAVFERLRAHDASVKSAATRKELRRLSLEKEEEDRKRIGIGPGEPLWELPKKQRPGQDPLTPEQMRPRIHPDVDPGVLPDSAFNTKWHPTGFASDDSGADYGEQKWILVKRRYFRTDEPPEFTTWPHDAWRQYVISEVAKKRNPRMYWQARLYVIRGVPFNPNYKGIARLERKQGKWEPFFVSSRRVANGSVPEIIWQAIHANKVDEFGRTAKDASVHQQAETRIVEIRAILLRNVDRRRSVPGTFTVDDPLFPQKSFSKKPRRKKPRR